MNKNNIKGLFDTLSPNTEQKEKIHAKIISASHGNEIVKVTNSINPRPQFRRRYMRPALAGAALCAALAFSYIIFFSTAPAFVVYAYGTDVEITREAVEITTGTISDNGEMNGHLFQLYVAGERIESIQFSCANQYLEFNDWTELQPFVGRVKEVEVSYKDVPPSEYYYLRIDWIPWDTQRVLVENEDVGIADLSSELREDVITLDVVFDNGSTAKQLIYVRLGDDGSFTANLLDD